MAIADLLWACPACGLDRGLRGSDNGATCTRCGTRYERARGAMIRAVRPGEGERVRSAASWVDDLPDPVALLDAANPVRSAEVRAKFVERFETVREDGRYVNRIEIFGQEVPGSLELGLERLSFVSGAMDPVVWDFEHLRAVQASSRTLQVRGGGHPLASFAFLDDSSFLWEKLLGAALGGFCRRSGRGELVELQPRIFTRPIDA